MKSYSEITIGLPDGNHLKEAVIKLLKKSKLDIPNYTSTTKSRSYESSLRLPSGMVCRVLIDKPRDLVFSLVEGRSDIILTGSDYVDDFLLYIKQSKNIPKIWNRYSIVSAHQKHEHLNFHEIRMACLVSKKNPLSINKMIKNKIICYTEFPFLASRYFQKLPGYKEKYGVQTPRVLSSFSSSDKNNNLIDIVYSNGATESKLINNSNAVIIDLVRSGRTMRNNNLKLLKYIGKPIFNTLYKRTGLSLHQEKIIKEFVDLLEKNPLWKI